MKNCLCCGKPLNENNINGWHKSCIKKFFGTEELPEINLSEEVLNSLALNSVKQGLTVTGVQKKLSLHLSKEKKNSRLTLINYPTGFILKPQVDKFECLPELEHLCMSMADAIGIKTVPHALIKMNNDYAYITKRIDRKNNKGKFIKLAMEDFCQLSLRNTSDKYKGSYEQCIKIINQYSFFPGVDTSNLFILLVFSYIIGNSDMHLKNLSLIETSAGSNEYVLSPTYDLLAVSLVLPSDDEEVALTLNGKKNNLTKNDFYSFAKRLNIGKISAKKIIHKIIESKNKLIELCNESLISENMKERFIKLISERCQKLE